MCRSVRLLTSTVQASAMASSKTLHSLSCLFCHLSLLHSVLCLGCVFTALRYRSYVKPLIILFVARYLLQNGNESWKRKLNMTCFTSQSKMTKIHETYCHTNTLKHKHWWSPQYQFNIHSYKKTQRHLLKNAYSSTKTVFRNQFTEYVVNKLPMMYLNELSWLWYYNCFACTTV